jgi:hypothetical protein
MGRPTKLTPATHATIVAALRAGAFGPTAAEAAGISRRSFYSWMARGQAALDALTDDQDDQELADRLALVPRTERPYARLAALATQAQAVARLHAEQRVYRERPDLWLIYGPGRDRTPDAPGWTNRRVVAGPSTPPALGPVKLHVVNDWADTA